MIKPDCILLYGNHSMPMTKYAGTFRIATELRNNGYTVQTIDLLAFNGFDEDLKIVLDKFISEKTLWIGISTTFLFHVMGYPFFKTLKSKKFQHKKNPDIDKNLVEFVNYIKEKNPKIKLIMGGSRKFMVEDYGFKIFSFYSDTEIIEYTNYCAKKTNRINLKFFQKNIQGSEYSDFHNSQIIFEKTDIVTNDKETLPIEISRGCIFNCKFCSFPMNGKTKGDFIKRPQILLDELNKNYEIHGTTDYLFSDDTYNDSEQKVKLLYDEVFSKLNFKLQFTTYLRLDLIMRFPEMADYLKESGLISAVFGIETINKKSGVCIGKGVDPELQIQFLRELKNNQFSNILTHSGLLVGLPKDRPNEMDLIEEFIFSDRNPLDHVSVDPLYITPSEEEYKGYRNDYSTFDLEYKKYGYECYLETDQSARTEIKWRNNQINMTFDQAYDFANRMNYKIANQTDKFKIGGFKFPFYKGLGIPESDLLTLSKRQIQKKYNIQKLIDDKKHLYRTLLLNEFLK